MDRKMFLMAVVLCLIATSALSALSEQQMPAVKFCKAKGADPNNCADRAPQLVHQEDPEFPEQARRDAVGHATVVLEIVVSSVGLVENIAVVKPAGHGFDASASEAVKKWKFKPATRKKEPV